ncbi:hypothetical protein OHT76_05485 [Streptomyces sp. NBC_00287]|uniref:hypothetical protein n=1 Tax=Streptomyces sp. NBC_00287 TaxID=2975702 RepID=UPI002E2B0965|nr:hypothetical protein [Streptomyces sp. NBC_00287]
MFDVQAEVLSGFLSALATIDVDRPRILVRLRWAAYRAGFAALSEALDAPVPVAGEFRSTPPKAPWGHPDLVLARAVRHSVLTSTEADLIGSTRLEDTLVADWAERHGTTSAAAYKARRRAEQRLVAFLGDEAEQTSPEDPVAAYVTEGLAPSASRARPSRHSRGATSTGQPHREWLQAKSSAALSKDSADSGLLGRGGSPNAPASQASSEVHPCA